MRGFITSRRWGGALQSAVVLSLGLLLACSAGDAAAPTSDWLDHAPNGPQAPGHPMPTPIPTRPLPSRPIPMADLDGDNTSSALLRLGVNWYP